MIKKSLHKFADHYGPRHTIPWNSIEQGLLQPQRELYPNQPKFNHRRQKQLLEFLSSFNNKNIAKWMIHVRNDDSIWGFYKIKQGFPTENWQWQ